MFCVENHFGGFIVDWNGQLASLYKLHCVNNYMQPFVYVCMYIHIEAYLLFLS